VKAEVEVQLFDFIHLTELASKLIWHRYVKRFHKTSVYSKAELILLKDSIDRIQEKIGVHVIDTENPSMPKGWETVVYAIGQRASIFCSPACLKRVKKDELVG